MQRKNYKFTYEEKPDEDEQPAAPHNPQFRPRPKTLRFPYSYSAVMRLVWKTIDSAPRNWRSIAKTLVLLDHLVKNGAEKVVADVQQHIHDITYLNEFRYIEGNFDRGSGGE